ncbi:2OG-Fe(II) oxygenase family protein [Cysteiniphilum halobium]|uniref:2OG-Fe(II) oxygenase family protein n=1 Tax=Cysteiniphilum halobium TaxID=2219059 RepID=UPI000E64D064
MISCNHYPNLESIRSNHANSHRLSEHLDVSLFTIFPFGIPDGFEYKNNLTGKWCHLGATNKIVILCGFLLEYWSQNKFKACTHRVSLQHKDESLRQSFAFFSIPAPGLKFYCLDNAIQRSTCDYFKSYLDLF